MSHQELLRSAWTEGRDGYMSALSQAQAWALREAWNDFKESPYGMLPYISQKVAKVGGGYKVGGTLEYF